MSDWAGLELSNEGNTLFASLEPASAHVELNEAELKAYIKTSGYDEWALSDAALDALLDAYNHGKPLQKLEIGEQRDGTFAVDIAEDAMQVWLEITPACAGKKVSPDDVYMTLGEAGVTFGIDTQATESACTANVAARVLVATGTPAVPGEDARFELLVNDIRDRSPQLNEKGLIDFREQGKIPTVIANEALMKRIPATTGKAGCNVRGEEIKADPGNDTPFSAHIVGAYIDKEDPNLLRAEINGQPVFNMTGVSVEHILHLREVNVASGNISFNGTIHIDGEVLSGMKVSATGDIIIGDLVDGATLEAGGDVCVGGGIIAKAHIKAAGAVTARFIENAHVYAGTTLAIEESALQSDLQANNQILIGIKNRHGKLAGGSARAMLLIQTPILGSSTGGVTQLVLGINPVLDAQYRELLQQLAKRKEEEEKLDQLLKHLVKQGDKSGTLARVSNTRQEVAKAWGKLLIERVELEKQLALVSEARVEVAENVAGAIDIAFGKKVLRLRRSYGAGTFSLQGETIEFSDAHGNVMTAT